MQEYKIYRGQVIFTKERGGFTCVENGYIAASDGKIMGVYESLPEELAGVSVVDFGNKLLIPSFVDIHLHAPQFENMGLGLDKELLPWLNEYAFPEESKFEDTEYAGRVYAKFTDELVKHGTTRAVIFGTIHTEATAVLMEMLERRGLGAYVGRVNMDRNAVDYLTEETSASISETEKWLCRYSDKNARVKPIITPRFTISCSDGLMDGLGKLAKKYGVPVQSHLSENRSEVQLVKELAKAAASYAESYNIYGLFGNTMTIMAHCVYCTPWEMALMREKHIFVAHCPDSNMNISSGIAPVRQYLEGGVQVGLGTDISGGHSISVTNAIVSAIQSSKMYTVLIDRSTESLTLSEAFYMATKGGGKVFGKVGSFEEGYDLDMLVIDDEDLCGVNKRLPVERLARFIYNGSYHNIYKRYAFGNEI